MLTQEDNPGKAAAAKDKVLFFKNVRLLSMRDHHCHVIRVEMKGATSKPDMCRHRYIETTSRFLGLSKSDISAMNTG